MSHVSTLFTNQNHASSHSVNLDYQKKAIILDDDKFYCLLFKQNVSKFLICDFAINEKSFFKKIACNHYDFAFIDFNLHGTNAIEIAKQMQDYFDLPVVVISSSLNNLYSCDVPLDNICGTISKWENPGFMVDKAMKYVSKYELLSPGLL